MKDSGNPKGVSRCWYHSLQFLSSISLVLCLPDTHRESVCMKTHQISITYHLAFHLPGLLAPLPSQPDPLLALLLPFHSKTTSMILETVGNVLSCVLQLKSLTERVLMLAVTAIRLADYRPRWQLPGLLCCKRCHSERGAGRWLGQKTPSTRV